MAGTGASGSPPQGPGPAARWGRRGVRPPAGGALGGARGPPGARWRPPGGSWRWPSASLRSCGCQGPAPPGGRGARAASRLGAPTPTAPRRPRPRPPNATGARWPVRAAGPRRNARCGPRGSGGRSTCGRGRCRGAGGPGSCILPAGLSAADRPSCRRRQGPEESARGRSAAQPGCVGTARGSFPRQSGPGAAGGGQCCERPPRWPVTDASRCTCAWLCPLQSCFLEPEWRVERLPLFSDSLCPCTP